MSVQIIVAKKWFKQALADFVPRVHAGKIFRVESWKDRRYVESAIGSDALAYCFRERERL